MLIGIDPIQDFLATVMWTSKIKDDHPVSVILQAPSAGGKSSLIRRLRCPVSQLFTDLTTRELSGVARDKDTRYVLLSDLQAIFAHKSTVITMTLQALRNLTEEGYCNDPFTGQKVEKQIGFIAGVPSDTLNDDGWRKLAMFITGDMASRFLHVQYDYKRATLLRIHDSIEKSNGSQTEFIIKGLPQEPDLHAIELSSALARECRKLSDAIRGRGDKMGTRTHLQIRTLVKAHAARSGRDIVKREDYEYVASFADLIKGEERVL